MTPNYILAEETKMKKLRLEAVKKAIKYEEKSRQLKKILVTKCMRIRKRKRKEETKKKVNEKRREVYWREQK